MAVAAELVQPETYIEEQEVRKSFDVLASVRMMQYDLQTFGAVLPETRERVRDEELSLLTEGVERAAKTTFVLRGEGDDLVYFDRGAWQSYTSMLITGKDVAKTEAEADFRRKFLLDEAEMHLSQGYKMRALKPGEQMVWSSPYPQHVEDWYGADFLKSCGRFPERKMGFIYMAYRTLDGDIVLESQTVDNSNEASFKAVHRHAFQNPAATTEELVDVYDQELSAQTGKAYYAGRLNAEYMENAWETVLQQNDLVEYMLQKLESLASKNIPRHELEEAATKHMYGVWAAFKRRIDGEQTSYYTPVRQQAYIPAVHFAMLEQEVAHSFNEFVSKGRVMVGCGGAITMTNKDSVMDASGADVFSSIFGNKTEHSDDEDKYGSLTFECGKGHRNRRPRGKLIPNCTTCGISVKC
jgi:hypothetical protein